MLSVDTIGPWLGGVDRESSMAVDRAQVQQVGQFPSACDVVMRCQDNLPDIVMTADG